ncbi:MULTISPECIES: N(5)-(carboxyethyl)ornithine synthase [Enterococcus]|jgi:N5-(carboxyethyl)ornithine synthase|uniref:N(5)-(Carboxyethyl)ornithine synthase n=1 Tax=Enterococcus xiangfangensis TaxID=1296537 RepID=A0ABU3FEU0_9ENTE|nr:MULTISPECIES: N(5)-(carboxyethyl)ornithine synthase [Enterococcus]EIB6790380.1 N(5)-(carboxyethyl)ornithine synthase [Enterococcus faecalis]KAF1303804.1 N(5)-(carboxyethyl)ornithine synthase [Enterococcus sp. JM9B]MDT2760552.1 N(5)-(carboxyethyl)ornithine synthase [Enterococcus xiangfangensis]
MKLGFIKSNFPNERRVPLLPEHIKQFANSIYIENGFGDSLSIPDDNYRKAGCTILTRSEIFASCEGIFSLKLLQPSDYDLIRQNQMIIGWTHPLGSGKEFMETQAIPKNLYILDIDNQRPMMYYQENAYPTQLIPRNFVYQNSFYAGYAGVLHALLSFGLLPNSNCEIAILGSGNAAQGAFHAISKISSSVRLFYRKTLPQFKQQLSKYSIIINGIEVGDSGKPIMTIAEQGQLKTGAFIIDIAADAGNAIEGNQTTTVPDPIYQKNGIYYYTLPNTPTFAYRNVSQILSEQFSKYIFKNDISAFIDEIEDK